VTADPPDGDPSDHEPDEQPEGRLRPTSATSLSVAAAIGLVVGGSLRPVSLAIDGTAPIVTWIQALSLVFVACFVGALAWDTWRTVHVRRRHLEPHRAVNRLVLARACALVGALVAAGYAAYAVSWLGDDSELAGQRMLRSGVAAAAGVAIVICSLLLERACRLPSRRDDP
jgi:MFS family permease